MFIPVWECSTRQKCDAESCESNNKPKTRCTRPVLDMMSLETRPLDALYKSEAEDFNEFIPVDDSTLESYHENLDLAQDLPPGPGQHKGARQEPKQKRRRSRNAHQLLLNKLAQVRYRERKRQKQAGLEGRLKDLEGKVRLLHEAATWRALTTPIRSFRRISA